MNKKICLIYNYAQHYRLGIFSLLDQEMDVDFYFGNTMGDVKKLDYGQLKNFRKELKNIPVIYPVYWQKGAIRLAFQKKYGNYLLLGEYYCLSTWMVAVLCKIFNKRVYFWTHGWYGDELFLKKQIKKLFFSLSDGLFLYGDYARKLMINKGFKPEKLHVIYNSLNYEYQLSIRRTLSVSGIYKSKFRNTHPTILFIGRLTYNKRLSILIELVSFFKGKAQPVNLLFIGDGEAKEELVAYADKLHVSPFIWFYGACYNEKKIAQLIYEAELCISPGNVGLTAMHSLMYGTPVLTHNNLKNQMPEFESIRENETGGFFDVNDFGSIVEKTECWITLLKEKREMIRNNCFAVIDKKYNPAYQIHIISKVINDEKYQNP